MKVSNKLDFELLTEYSGYCLLCKQCSDICNKLEELTPEDEEYQKLVAEAREAYLALLQWYNILVGNASIAVANVKVRLRNNGVLKTPKKEDEKTIQQELNL